MPSECFSVLHFSVVVQLYATLTLFALLTFGTTELAVPEMPGASSTPLQRTWGFSKIQKFSLPLSALALCMFGTLKLDRAASGVFEALVCPMAFDVPSCALIVR